MGQTLLDKVWDSHVAQRVEGQPDLLYVDLHLVHEVTSPQAFEALRLAGRSVRRPDLTLDSPFGCGIGIDAKDSSKYKIDCDQSGLAMPDRSYFGEKDYQQLQVLKRMARDLAMPVEIIGMPTIREFDGLALSSRNRYLSPGERKTAVAMHRELMALASTVGDGRTSCTAAASKAAQALLVAGFDRVDYLTVVDAELVVTREPEHACRRRHLPRAPHRQLVRVDVGIGRALVAARGDQHVHLGSRTRPARERAPARHLGIVGMGIDGESRRRCLVDQLGHGEAA